MWEFLYTEQEEQLTAKHHTMPFLLKLYTQSA